MLGQGQYWKGGVLWAMLLVGVLLLGLCGTDSTRTLTLVTGKDASGANIYRALVDEWNACRGPDDPPVRLVEVSDIADLQREEMVRALQADGVEYDILNIDNQWTAEFARAGRILPVQNWVDLGGFLDQPRQAVRHEDDLWAVPFIADVGLLYYRSDLVDRADLEGHDWKSTLEELDRHARDAGVAHGYTAQLSGYEGLTVNTMETMRGMNGAMVESGTLRPALAKNPQRTALRVLTDGLRKGAIDQQAVDSTESDSVDAFLEGRVLAMRNWPIWYDTLARSPQFRPGTNVSAGGQGEEGKEDMEFDVLPLPSYSAVLGGQSLAVSADAPNPSEAFDVITYLTDTERQRRLFRDAGYAPVRAAAYTGDVPEASRDPQVCPRGNRTAGTVEQRRGAYASELLESVQHAQQRGSSPHYQQFSQTFYAGLHPRLEDAANGKGGDPLDPVVLTELDSQLNAALEGH